MALARTCKFSSCRPVWIQDWKSIPLPNECEVEAIEDLLQGGKCCTAKNSCYECQHAVSCEPIIDISEDLSKLSGASIAPISSECDLLN